MQKDATATWISTTDDIINKNETFAVPPPICPTKNDANDVDVELVNLSHQFDAATKLVSRSESVLSVRSEQFSKSSVCLWKNSTTDNSQKDETTSAVIPMKDRLAVAQRKIADQRVITARKQAQIDQINKKVMALTFPAGFIVDNKAIEERIQKNSRKCGRYQAAQENEQW